MRHCALSVEMTSQPNAWNVLFRPNSHVNICLCHIEARLSGEVSCHTKPLMWQIPAVVPAKTIGHTVICTVPGAFLEIPSLRLFSSTVRTSCGSRRHRAMGAQKKALKALHSLSTSKPTAATVWWDRKLFSSNFFSVRISFQHATLKWNFCLDCFPDVWHFCVKSLYDSSHLW